MVNILGTQYEIKFVSNDNVMLNPSGQNKFGGMARYYDKTIYISNDLLDKNYTEKQNIELIMDYLKHEIVHVYLWESGLNNYSNDELLVEWISSMQDKMVITSKTASEEVKQFIKSNTPEV